MELLRDDIILKDVMIMFLYFLSTNQQRLMEQRKEKTQSIPKHASKELKKWFA
jgi:hypothetical protein